jgi:predicted nucleic acid-binding protein
MKRLLLDLNVLLDVVLERPAAPVAAKVWAALERGRGQGYLPAHGLTTIFYVVSRAKGRAFARRATEALMQAFAVASVDQGVLRRALALDWPDFEDAVCAAAAEACECDALVTRDPAGFPDSPVEVVDPATALAWLSGD